MEIELAGCNLGWALDKSSRKNVFQLNTNSDFQILFQTDDKELATEWYDKIAELVDIQVKKGNVFYSYSFCINSIQ